MQLPIKKSSKDEIITRMKNMAAEDADWRSGRTFSLVYYGGDEVLSLIKEAYTMFMSENGLSPMAFPSLRRFENEVVAMTAQLLGGGKAASGSMTSGGTESILMAVKTAREKARAERPEIKSPNMVLPITVHPAFEKAAHYFDVEAVHVPVDDSFRADVEAASKAVDDNTVLMVGSAPAYPHGVVDPISDLAAIAEAKGIPFHVDACLGGFLLPWVRRLGYDIPPFDLSVPGVTSISADIHKYGFAAKGASTIIYKNEKLRRYQYFAYTDFPGGLYGSPTMTGTRPGGGIAAAWAVLNYMGEEGYLKIARRIMDVTKKFQDGITSIPELKILGRPAASVFAFGSDDLNTYALGDAMEKRGWHLDRNQTPASLHIMLTPMHEQAVEPFLEDLKASVEEVKGTDATAVSGMAAIYGMVAAIPEKGMVKDLIIDFLSETFKPGSDKKGG